VVIFVGSGGGVFLVGRVWVTCWFIGCCVLGFGFWVGTMIVFNLLHY